MTLKGATKQLIEMHNDETMPSYFKFDIAKIIGTLLMDAQEVKHGHWSLNPHNRAWDVCSACGIGTKRREYGINPDGTEYVTEDSYRYCPNCGARMDEVEDAKEE